MFKINNLTITLNGDQRTIIDNFSLEISPGDKVAIIGEEGNGKSSLIKAIADVSSLSSYASVTHNNVTAKLVIAYIPQNLQIETSTTLYDYLSNKVESEDLDYVLLYKLVNSLGAIDPLEFGDRVVDSLSGGERLKFVILVELLKRPNVLILDEPTNDLDLSAIEWLESYLVSTKIPVLFVSHDVDFLRTVATSLVHIELTHHKQKSRITHSNLNYDDYMAWRESALNKQEQNAINDAKRFAKKEERFRSLHDSVQSQLRSVSRQNPTVGKNLKDKMKTVKSMGKRYDKERELLTKRVNVEEASAFDLHNTTIPSKKKILEINLDALKVENRVLSENVFLEIIGPRKIAIIGNNGVGKSTLLKEIIRNHKNDIPYFYMPQDFLVSLDLNLSAVEFLSVSGDKTELSEIRTRLGSLNFTAEEMVCKMSGLSGGQLIKVYFEKMRRSNASVLYLDEPTRNLSPLTRPVIIAAINDFEGVVVAITHDRDFIRSCFDDVYELTKDGLKLVNE